MTAHVSSSLINHDLQCTSRVLVLFNSNSKNWSLFNDLEIRSISSGCKRSSVQARMSARIFAQATIVYLNLHRYNIDRGNTNASTLPCPAVHGGRGMQAANPWLRDSGALKS